MHAIAECDTQLTKETRTSGMNKKPNAANEREV